VLQYQTENPRAQMDFDAELRNDLFGVRGNIILSGNSSLAYLMLNATLCQRDIVQFNTKYLLMQIDPNRDYSFEIIKNVKILAGEYDCILVAEGPQGALAEERRRVSLVSGQEPVFEQVPWPVEVEEKVSGQEDEEILPKKIANDAAEKKDVVAMASEKNGSSSAEASLRASSTLTKENGSFMGSITSKKYHSLDCRYALKIKPENCIYFQSIGDAEGQGYLPCKVCNP
jgi:hypothetical protein